MSKLISDTLKLPKAEFLKDLTKLEVRFFVTLSLVFSTAESEIL